jgi:hypothetical protein
MVGNDGAEIELMEIPREFNFYSRFGMRVGPPQQSFSEKLRHSAVGGKDSSDGLILGATSKRLDSLQSPFDLKIVGKDLSGRTETIFTFPRVDENLLPDSLCYQVLADPRDGTKNWKLVDFAELSY